jgi:SHS2 domain-containing protein
MFGYMTELHTVEEQATETIEAEGHDLESLLFKFLDEFLFLFSAEPFFIPKRIKITDFNKESFTIKAEGYGETFDLKKHPQGTEVKAITYSNMQIHHTADKHEVYVIVDI